ncbi:MAG: Ldh family oxidoreductase [Steroidobacteraceae bacterium]
MADRRDVMIPGRAGRLADHMTSLSATSPPSRIVRIRARDLEDGVASIFTSLGLGAAPAGVVSRALVCADLEGIASHGVMLLPMYVQRLRAGSVSAASDARVVSERDGTVVLDAQNVLGQLSSHQAVGILIERAPRYGLAAVAVRNGFHFGTAGYWARMLAERGLIGIVASNTRPLMPAPGGAEPVVGNNPLAIAVPSAEEMPIVLDMAMSASAMGKIRLAAAESKPIPDTWATDVSGRSTTDPAEAIRGMLLPAAGAKGFGLAFMIDLLCGALSGGGVGAAVRPLYSNLADPYNCSHLFITIDVAHFGDPKVFAQTVAVAAGRVRQSARAPDVEQLFAPGDLARREAAVNGEWCPLAEEVARQLLALAQELGVSRNFVFSPG